MAFIIKSYEIVTAEKRRGLPDEVHLLFAQRIHGNIMLLAVYDEDVLEMSPLLSTFVH